LIANILNNLYHYTTEYGQLAIIESGMLRPSLTKPNGRDVLLGEGQYFTSIAPETIACRSRTEMTSSQQQAGKLSLFQLSRHILGGSLSLKKLDYFIEFDVSNLIIRHSIEHEYIYLCESKIDLDISNRMIRWGKTLA
jgi:HYD1 signature containing ADP-ribosyltransferase